MSVLVAQVRKTSLSWKRADAPTATQKRFLMIWPQTWFAPSAGFASEFVVWALIVKKERKGKPKMQKMKGKYLEDAMKTDTLTRFE